MMLVKEKVSCVTVLLSFFAMVISPLPPLLAREAIKIGGTGTGLETMRKIGAAFTKKYPDIDVVVVPSLGSSGGIKAAAESVLDLAISARMIKDDELKLNLMTQEYARTPFIFITNKNVKITDLTTEEIVKIYAQEAKKWPDGKNIRLVLRPAKDVDTALLKSISAELDKAVGSALSVQNSVTALTDQDAADTVEKTPGAFSISSLTLAVSEERQFNILSYNGVSPSIENFRRGLYSLSKHLYLVFAKNPTAKVTKFIDFIQSAEGARLLEKYGNLPVKVEKK